MIMEKAKLNNQIVQCRAAIKKARVCIIRKKIKKLKILKSCKNEKEKNKKLKKSERLLEEIFLLKKVKEDDVTKFALQQSNLNDVIQKTPLNDHEHVYATLAVYPDVLKQLNQVKESFPDPEALLKLLQSLGAKQEQKKKRKRNKDPSFEPVQINKNIKDDSDNEEVKSPVVLPKIKSKTIKNTSSELADSDIIEAKPLHKSNDIQIEIIKLQPEQKVDDPFFVSKKVSIPKLILDEVKENPKSEIKFSKADTSFTRPQQFNSTRPIQKRSTDFHRINPKSIDPPAPPVEEKLHPSWAAKKIKLIQPFQGTKIKFDD